MAKYFRERVTENQVLRKLDHDERSASSTIGAFRVQERRMIERAKTNEWAEMARERAAKNTDETRQAWIRSILRGDDLGVRK